MSKPSRDSSSPVPSFTMRLDSKQTTSEAPVRRPRVERTEKLVPVIAAGLFLILLALFRTLSNDSHLELPFEGSHKHDVTPRDFGDIEPSEELQWHPCFKTFFCARLTVPMDYHRPLSESADHPKVHLALVLVPGQSTNFSKPPILINPGGPGAPGVGAALSIGSSIQKVIDVDQPVIGFDPRGIGATRPLIDCFTFPSSGTEPNNSDIARADRNRRIHSLTSASIGLVGTSDASLRKSDEKNRAVNKLRVRDKVDDQDSILRHAATTMVARDMLSIIDAWDAYKNKALASSIHVVPGHSETERTEADSLQETRPKLSYWGLSYGSLLGATFSAMFPDRVGRVLLDGVVDADHYVDPIWEDSIEFADDILDSFHRYCFEAGTNCALYREGDTESDIRNRYHSAMESLRNESIVTADDSNQFPIVLEYSTVKALTFMSLYRPIKTFPFLAKLISQIYESQFSQLIRSLESVGGPPFQGSDANLAIMCSDKRYPLNDTLPLLQSRYETMAEQYSFADAWMTLMIGCNFWPVKSVDPPMRWDDHPINKPQPINTSFPLMFLSNSLDPVTPVTAGIAMAKKFTDAGIVEIESEGHCSLNAVSLCALAAIRRYFREGLVPPPPGKDGVRMKCESNEKPWKPYTGEEREVRHAVVVDGVKTSRLAMDAERELMGAWKEMQEKSKDFTWYGQQQGFNI